MSRNVYCWIVAALALSSCTQTRPPTAVDPSAKPSPTSVTAVAPHINASPAPDPPTAKATSARGVDQYVVAGVALDPVGMVWAVRTSCADGEDRTTCRTVIERSSNGGVTWKVVKRLAGSSVDPHIVAPTPANIWAQLGPDGALVISHDAGRSWDVVPMGPLGALSSAGGGVWALECGDDRTCAVARVAGHADALALTLGQPGSLRSHYPGASSLLTPASDMEAYVAVGGSEPGQGHLDRTIDGGRTWRHRTSPCTDRQGSIKSISAAGGVLWAVCGWEPSAGNQRKWQYTSGDGGGTWSSSVTVESGGYATELHTVSAKEAWRTGGRAPVLHTTDGGARWKPLLGSLFGDASGGSSPDSFVASSRHVVLTWRNTVMSSVDSGRHWTKSSLAG